jgi:hypothetical protein
MDQAEVTRGTHQYLESLGDLIVVIGCQELHDDTHGPTHAGSLVRTTRGVDDGTVGKIWVRFAQYKVSCVAIHLVRVFLETKMWNT